MLFVKKTKLIHKTEIKSLVKQFLKFHEAFLKYEIKLTNII